METRQESPFFINKGHCQRHRGVRQIQPMKTIQSKLWESGVCFWRASEHYVKTVLKVWIKCGPCSMGCILLSVCFVCTSVNGQRRGCLPSYCQEYLLSFMLLFIWLYHTCHFKLRGSLLIFSISGNLSPVRNMTLSRPFHWGKIVNRFASLLVLPIRSE